MTGLVLAGGASRRMGRDKALLELDGEPLVRRAVATLRRCCGRVLVASGDGTRLPDVGDAQVADAVAGEGPLGGLVAGLAAARTPLVAVVAVDLPFADAGILRVLADHWGGEPAVVPTVAGRAQPLHAVYATAAAGALRRCLDDGRRGVTDVVTSLGARLVDERGWSHRDPTGRFATNLNSPADLDRLRESGQPPM